MELDQLLNDIEKLRKKLHEHIDMKHINLQDSEILVASEELDKAITYYFDLLLKKNP